MIFIIEQALRSTITGLNFVGRYGGIVRPISQVGQTEDGQNFTNTFPVSRYVNVADCFDDGYMRDLIPDETYKSVVYWEERGNSSIRQGGPKGLQWAGSQTMRLVVWLNFKLLGLTDYDATDELQLYALSQIQAKHGNIFTNGTLKFRIDVLALDPVERNPRQVFGQYTYQDKDWAFNWPYGFFAIDFNFRAEIAAGCITAPTVSGVSCIETY